MHVYIYIYIYIICIHIFMYTPYEHTPYVHMHTPYIYTHSHTHTRTQIALKPVGAPHTRPIKRRLQLVDALLSARYTDASSGALLPFSLLNCLDESTLSELTDTDELMGLSPTERQTLAQLCVRLCDESDHARAFKLAEALAASSPNISQAAYLAAGSIVTQHAGFWEAMSLLATPARAAGKHQLAERVVWEAFRARPGLDNMNLVLESIQHVGADNAAERKREAQRVLLERAKVIPPLDRFGGLARLGCLDSALEALDQAVKRNRPAQVLVYALGFLYVLRILCLVRRRACAVGPGICGVSGI
jgi:hypothetical protein